MSVKNHSVLAKKFYRSKQWIKCREAYIPSVHGLCERCEDPGYILDHIIEINEQNINDPHITLNHENLQYLCLPCHNKKTFKKHSAIADGFRFNADGELEAIDE